MSLEKQTKKNVRDWWASNPMTYGETHGTSEHQLGTKEFFEQADARFYSWNTPLHTKTGKFGKIFDYDRYKGKSVLEVGCGMGCLAMNWAKSDANLTAVDLNPVAIAQTRRRFELFNLKATIKESDARTLPFPDNSFDYVYSWGVLHHSPNIQKSLDEVYRVVKPGGRIGIMLYNRNSLLYRYTIKQLEGFVHLEDEFLNEVELASRYGDGGREEGNPHTWPVTPKEVKQELLAKFSNVKVDILGTDIEHIFDMIIPRLGSWVIPNFLQKPLARRWGWSLWMMGQKPE